MTAKQFFIINLERKRKNGKLCFEQINVKKLKRIDKVKNMVNVFFLPNLNNTINKL